MIGVMNVILLNLIRIVKVVCQKIRIKIIIKMVKVLIYVILLVKNAKVITKKNALLVQIEFFGINSNAFNIVLKVLFII